MAPTWPSPPTPAASLLRVLGRRSGGSVPAYVAAGGGGGRPGTRMRGRGGRRPWRRRSHVACDRIGCAGAPRRTGPLADIGRGRRGGSGRSSPPPPRLWMGARWPRGRAPRTRPGYAGAASADRHRPRKQGSETATAYRRARSPRWGPGRAEDAPDLPRGSDEPRVGRMCCENIILTHPAGCILKPLARCLVDRILFEWECSVTLRLF